MSVQRECQKNLLLKPCLMAFTRVQVMIMILAVCSLFSVKVKATSLLTPPLKTPAEASVHFQIQLPGSNFTLCSGARISHDKILTTQTCFEELQARQAAGLLIQAVSSPGFNYGIPVLPETGSSDSVLLIPEMPALTSIELKITENKHTLWPEHYTDSVDTDSTMKVYLPNIETGQEMKNKRAINRRSADQQTVFQKEAFQKTVSVRCDDEFCQLTADEPDLRDGAAVFYNNQLLCIHAQDQSCIRTRSLDKRQAISCVNEYTRADSGCVMAKIHCDNCRGQSNKYLRIPDCGGASCTINEFRRARGKGKRQAPNCLIRDSSSCSNAGSTGSNAAIAAITSVGGVVIVILTAVTITLCVYRPRKGQASSSVTPP